GCRCGPSCRPSPRAVATSTNPSRTPWPWACCFLSSPSNQELPMDQLHKVLPTPSQTPAKSGSDRNLRAELVQLTSRAAQDEQRREASSMANSLSSVEPPSQRQMDALWTLWERMAAMFPGKFTRDNGTAPAKADGTLSTAGQTWATALRGLTARQLGEGLSACLLK